MSGKRKDNKGRNLRDGEIQRADGKYEYKYIYSRGKRHSVYSWKLVDTDKVPNGKRCKDSLRSLEKQIKQDLEDGIDISSVRKMSLNDFFENYMETKFGIKESTKAMYRNYWRMYLYDSIGLKHAVDIKYSEIKRFYISLLNNVGIKFTTLKIVNSIVRPVFDMMVRDNYIRNNPTDGIMKELKNGCQWKQTKKHALTIQEQSAFINYIATHNRYRCWLTLLVVLLGTGCRIGEAMALRWEDCDFNNNIINIDHTVYYYKNEFESKGRNHITTPKSRAGIRKIPMLSDVKEVLLQERKNQMKNGVNTVVVDGYSNFIFKRSTGNMLEAKDVNRVIKKVCRLHNEEEIKRAEEEGREPVILPDFSVHILRHTFCTRLCENETNLKVIQEIMGHENISTTMDIYNEATDEKKRETFENLDNKIRIIS